MAIENFERALAGHPFFAGMEKAQLETIVGCAANQTFDAGEFLTREGAPADQFYVIRQGKVAVEIFVPSKGAVRLETLEDGDVLGWSWLFPPYKAHFDARALTLVRAFALDGTCLRGKCDKDPAFGYALIRRFAPLLIQRLEAARLQLLDLYGVTT